MLFCSLTVIVLQLFVDTKKYLIPLILPFMPPLSIFDFQLFGYSCKHNVSVSVLFLTLFLFFFLKLHKSKKELL